MSDLINEVMDFFLNLIIDKSIDKMNKHNRKRLIVFLVLSTISVFTTGLLGLWFYLANKKIAAFIFWLVMLIIIGAILMWYKSTKVF